MSGKVPPSSRAGRQPPARGMRGAVRRAVALFERFTGHDAEHGLTIDIPDHDVLTIIGECDGVLYTTVRDGRLESYVHEFRSKDKPLLCVSDDGRQLYIVGGAYVFTERGVVDLTDRKNLPARLRR